MKVLTWIIRLTVILLLTAFAIRNAEIVTLKTFLGYEWQAPLVLVLLAFFVGGVIIGFLGLVGSVFRLRREVSQLRRTQERLTGTPSEPPSTAAHLPPPL